MKIISAPPQTFSIKASCRTCSTLVELEAGDLVMHDDQREGTSYEWHCPTCRGRCFLDGDAVPREVRWKIKRA